MSPVGPRPQVAGCALHEGELATVTSLEHILPPSLAARPLGAAIPPCRGVGRMSCRGPRTTAHRGGRGVGRSPGGPARQPAVQDVAGNETCVPSRLIWLVHVAKGTGNGAEVHLDGHTGELLHYYAAMGDLTAKLKPAQPTKPPASRPKPATGKLKAAQADPTAGAAATPISPVVIGAGAVVVAVSVGAWLAGRRRRA